MIDSTIIKKKKYHNVKEKHSKTHNWVKSIISMSIDDVKVSFTFHFWEKRWHDVYVSIERATMFCLAIKHGVEYARRIWISFISCVWQKNATFLSFCFRLVSCIFEGNWDLFVLWYVLHVQRAHFYPWVFLTDACVRLWLSVLGFMFW